MHISGSSQERAKAALRRKLGSGEILDALPIGVYCCDQDGYLVQFNRYAAELWGREPVLGEARYGGAHRFFSLDGSPLQHDLSPVADVLRTKTAAHQRRVVIERPDGTRRTILLNADPLFGDDGALVGAVNCFQDVSELRRASEDLQQSRDELHDFFENCAVGLHVVDEAGVIKRANKAELELLGYDAGGYIGRNIADFHVDSAAIADVLARLGRGEVIDRIPARLRAKDGSIKQVLITSNAHRHDGRLHSRCFTFDVTDAKHAEQQVAEKDNRFRAVLDAVPVALYTTDAEGKITFYNQAAAELAGRKPQIGSDEWCVSWRMYWPDGTPLPHDECPMAIAIKERRPVRGAEAILERPDGTRVRFAPYPTPLFDKSGRLTGAINMLLDITERHEAEAQSAHLAAIVSTSDDAIISKRLDGHVVSWNQSAERIFGYTEKEMIGQPITRIIPPDLLPEETEILSKLRRGERVEHFQTVRVRKDGTTVHVSLSVSPMRDRHGNLIGASKVARDITEQKRAEELQRLLTAELNHRVRNTLATVQSIASQTVRMAKSPHEFAASFGGRLQALSHAHNLLTQSSWLNADAHPLIRDQVVLGGGVPDDRISCSGPSVALDPQSALHLALVIHELGTNARKYGALSVPDGRLSVQWTLRTNGEGRNFNLRWVERGGPNVTAPTTRGFGTRLIEQSLSGHGGEASIQYEAHGLICEITLPLPDATAGPLAGAYRPVASAQLPETRRQSGDVSIRGKRILVVEDEPLVAMDIAATLSEAGGEIIGPAATVDIAAAHIADSSFDVALLDANLGGHSVEGLAAALTQRNVPFAFVTGYGRDALPEAFRQAHVVGKPFNARELLRTIGQLVEQRSTLVLLPGGKPNVR